MCFQRQGERTSVPRQLSRKTVAGVARRVGRGTFPTGHVDHPAVAVLHQVARLAVDPAGRDAVAAEEVGIHRRGLAVAPGRGQVRQLRKMGGTGAEPLRANCLLSIASCV